MSDKTKKRTKPTIEEMRSAMASNRMDEDGAPDYTSSIALDSSYFPDANVPYCFGNMLSGAFGYKHTSCRGRGPHNRISAKEKQWKKSTR